MTKKILFALTNHDQLGNTGKKTGWYLPEVAHPYHVFTKAGYEVEFVSPNGGKTPIDEGSLSYLANDTVSCDILRVGSIYDNL
jgi:putative intracellular protease/amidase